MVQGHRCIEQGHPMFGAGLEVDLVVAGPRPADHHQVLCALGECAPRHPGTKNHQAVDALDVLGPDLHAVLPIPVGGIALGRGKVVEESPLNLGLRRIPAQADIAVRDLARLIEKIAGQSEPEDWHRNGPYYVQGCKF